LEEETLAFLLQFVRWYLVTIGVFGEGVIDRFIDSHGSTDVIGGSALNCAVALRRAGIEAEWIARVSTDTEGQSLAAYAAENHVASARMIRSNQPSSIVTIALQANGVPVYGFQLDGSVDWQWTAAEMEQAFRDVHLLQLSSLSCVLSPGADYLPEALHTLRENSPGIVITYDPNARPKAATDAKHGHLMKERIEQLIGLANLVKVSDEDLEWIAPQFSAEVVAADWSLRGPSLVVLTRGEQGSIAFCNGKEIASTKIHSLPMVDTVGAGDTYMAWLIRSIVEDHNFDIPTEPSAVTLMIEQASKAAAINCSRKGCQPPQRNEVLN
jgi:fructokinase